MKYLAVQIGFYDCAHNLCLLTSGICFTLALILFVVHRTFIDALNYMELGHILVSLISVNITASSKNENLKNRPGNSWGSLSSPINMFHQDRGLFLSIGLPTNCSSFLFHSHVVIVFFRIVWEKFENSLSVQLNCIIISQKETFCIIKYCNGRPVLV